MRILVVILDPRFGGIPKRVALVSEGVMGEGSIVSAVVPKGSDQAKHLLLSAGIPTEALTYGLLIPTKLELTHKEMALWMLKSLAFPALLIREIRSRQAEIVHVNGLYGIRAVAAAKIAGKRVVWHLVSTNYPKFLVWIWRILLSKAADVTIFVSETTSRFYVGKRSLRRSERIIFEAVDTGEFSRERVRLKDVEGTRSELHIGKEERIVLFVGNLNRSKGVEILIQAFSMLPRADPQVTLVISGQAIATQIGYREFLEKKVNDLNLGRRVRFVGRYPRLRELLASAEMLVVPSLAEGTPAVIMEAMSMNVPVIASRVGGISELVSEGRTGLLVPPGDVEALKGAIRFMLDNPEVRESMGKMARVTAIERFSKGICVQKHVDVYKELSRSPAKGTKIS
jgi:glycosyltransferase involved in cell wall biosynthesis